MLFGTLFGVLLVPGLYYLFAKVADRQPLVGHEDQLPLSEKHESTLAAEHALMLANELPVPPDEDSSEHE